MKIGSICDVVRGSSPRPQGDSRYYGGRIPRLMIADVTRDGMFVTPKIDSLTEEGASKSRPMKKGDLIIAVSGDPGRACILNVDACIHDGFVGLRNLDESKVHKPFLFYFLRYFKNTTKKGAVGAIFQNLTTLQIKNIELPDISVFTQIEIANFLNQAEALVEHRKQSILFLDELLSSSFLEMFGDPIKNTKSWKHDTLGAISFAVADIDHNMPKEVSEGGYPFISAKDLLDDGTISFEKVKRISSEDFFQLSRKIKPQKGDIIYSRIGAKLGKSRIVKVDFDFVASYSCCTIKPNTKITNTIFLNRLLDSPYLLRQALKDVRAIGVPDLGMDKIRKFKIILPPMGLQNKFSKLVERTEALKTHYQQSLQELENLYGSLSQRAFRGELEINKH